ncbi:MAG: phage BR0599 family protein, partial [Alphaproteobacteria bacterium]|nr:phage BR0599 family protein [Alphaproteobacteria bacterium]
TNGKLTFTTGANAARAMEIKRHTANTIELWHAMSNPIAPGDTFTVTAGCDKQFATCKSKFVNGINFRGFPYMPGNDAVLAGPALPLNGGSRYGN